MILCNCEEPGWYTSLVEAPTAELAMEAAADECWERDCRPVAALSREDVERYLKAIAAGRPDVVVGEEQ